MSDNSVLYRWIDGDGEAPGAPGLEPRWTSSQKDVVGTAYSTSSKVWWTLSHGTVNEIYYPTIDRPQMRDLEFLITDGETFVHEEKRDLDHEFSYLSPHAPAVRIVNSDPTGQYRLVKRIISDPHAPVLLIDVSVEAPPELLRKLKLYALLAPHLEVGGADNSGRVLDVAGRTMLLAWKGNATVAMAVDGGFNAASCGFVGSSDGYQDVTRHQGMRWHYGSALNGNIALTGEIDVSTRPHFLLSVGFGSAPHSALTRTVGSLNVPFDEQLSRFINQWERVKPVVKLAGAAQDGGELLSTSYQVLLSHEDKTFAGAFIASASIPWGQARSDSDLGGYHLVWTRDMTQTATALLACDHHSSAMRALTYLAVTQKADGSFPQNFWVNGAPYWSGVQLDETAFPVLLAWRLWKLDALGVFDPLPFIERAAGFLVRHAPITMQERWEECAGYSPSTLAVVITALICAADLLRSRYRTELATFLEEQADWIESHLEDWTATNDGILVPDVREHYMRIRPAEPAGVEPCVRMGPGTETIRIANRAPGERYEFEARAVIDGGFLELVRYGVRPADDPLIAASVKVVDAIIRHELPQGPGFRRYNHDGYGNHLDGAPFDGWGQGNCWPLLTGERAHYELARGRNVADLVQTIEGFASTGHMLPEQVWDGEDCGPCDMLRGQPTGSAMPLVWAHAEYIKLLRSVTDGRVFDRVEPVAERYRKPRSHASHEIWRSDRQVAQMASSRTLRIEAGEAFELTWSGDGWQSHATFRATSVGAAGFYADLPAGDSSALQFTFYWPDQARWEGRNFHVSIDRDTPARKS